MAKRKIMVSIERILDEIIAKIPLPKLEWSENGGQAIVELHLPAGKVTCKSGTFYQTTTQRRNIASIAAIYNIQQQFDIEVGDYNYGDMAWFRTVSEGQKEHIAKLEEEIEKLKSKLEKYEQ